MKTTVSRYSIFIGGHKTGVSLEEPFWDGFREIARLHGMTLSEIVGWIDGHREHRNLSSAIRVYVVNFFRARAQKP